MNSPCLCRQPPGHRARVPQQVPAIRHLRRVGRPAARTARVLGRPVAGDDRHARVRLRPPLERRRRPVGAQHPGGTRRRRAAGSTSTVPYRSPRCPARSATPSPLGAASGAALPRPRRRRSAPAAPPRATPKAVSAASRRTVARRHCAVAPGTCCANVRRGRAAAADEAPPRPPHAHRPPAGRPVAQRPGIAAVHPRRPLAARRAARGWRPRAGLDDDAPLLLDDALRAHPYHRVHPLAPRHARHEPSKECTLRHRSWTIGARDPRKSRTSVTAGEGSGDRPAAGVQS